MNAPLDAELARALRDVTLDDKYTLERGRAFMSGTQALVRLPMLQRERDRAAGLRTAGFVSGYRGSPLGGLDQALWKARPHLERHGVVFRPGLNEDLAATAVWGSQQVGLFPEAAVDGVFGLWYGKGPGVDRTADVFKHANAAGSAPHGGVLVIAGDDHGARSSTLPHQSDHVFKACGLPVMFPASVQEYLDFGLHGWAMSRWSGLWVAMKAVTDVVEASASVEVDPDRVHIVLPDDFALPPGGLGIRWPDSALAQEARLLDHKWYAALAYVRANRLDRIVVDAPDAWFGIVTAGKAYLDTRQALDELGLDAEACARVGLRLYKCGVVWPLEARGIREFAGGLDEILVVEEKRQLLEYAIKEELYNWRDDVRPRVYGKFDERDGRGGEWSVPMSGWLLPPHGELSPALIARAVGRRLLAAAEEAETGGACAHRPRGWRLPPDLRAGIEARLAILDSKERAPIHPRVDPVRTPTFCSGCPHNTSTHVPEGSRAMAGIGCHYMASWMPERHTATYSQMGGEGAPWIGLAPFTTTPHVFANLGDGTYFHSGVLAIRAAIAAGVNITYKLLYNDAVAMTGGQPIDGSLTVPDLVAQLRAEGVREVVVVTDDPGRYDAAARCRLAARDPVVAHALDGLAVEHRDRLDAVQRRLRDVPGVTVLVYDQTCAAEKRRRRKRRGADGQPAYPDPPRRVVINEAVCEGCGDCSVQSSCVSIVPVDTPLGRKRRIDQSSCNKDYSCLKGFCPSFVTIEGGRWRGRSRRGTDPGADWPALPEPPTTALDEIGARAAASDGAAAGAARDDGRAPRSARVYGILVTGVGGTGVVTIGQLLGMAAHLDGRGVSVLDMAGLAQKGGAVTSHVQIAARPDHLFATRIATGEADLVIGGDLVVTAGADALARMRPRVTRAVVNDDVTPTADLLRDPDWSLPLARMREDVLDAAGPLDVDFVEAQRLVLALCGDTLQTNAFLVGWACQRGWLPVSRAAFERAIELNGTSVDANRAAFVWGRRAAHDLEAVRRAAGAERSGESGVDRAASSAGRAAARNGSLAEQVAYRSRWLADYQDARLARRYEALVARVRAAEAGCTGRADGPLAEAVARGWFRMLAIKDEYEVARLHADPAFHARLREQFGGDWSLRFHFAPPLFARVDPDTGRPRKIAFGAWLLPVLRGMARLRILRGTPFDPFGWTAERRAERALAAEYEALVEELLAGLSLERHALAVELARFPESVRGFGPVRAASLAAARARQAVLLARWRGAPDGAAAVAPGPVTGRPHRVIELRRA